MPNNLPAENNWIDIIPPFAPEYSYTALVVISVLSFLAVVGTVFYICHRPMQRAKRQLRRLASRLHTTEYSHKAVCFEIYACLCTAWSIPHLHKLQFDKEASSQDWQRFMGCLTRFCFSQDEPGMEELQNVIREARMWLTKKVVAN